ncbi:ATP-binding cassette domain-containing protein [Blastococcus brunescens]|uniref:ATP-binding cassette domain-containing protein n=1 Tax=Blastococcus brunescens TaxID=1564165 RepID=A0ABZ1B3E8_9ACTN|nr:ATP-binding cassette domain-containing protein [Blastococcus sp. BMG 8361]WRL63580.1 ATP-binding cassette domain-containing protein [Blastococcus sp. BMG 8361]
MILEVSGIRKSYGSGETAHLAIADVSFAVEQGEFLCIVGPSGCGKTTLLRCLSGLMPPTSGSVELQGRVVRQPPRRWPWSSRSTTARCSPGCPCAGTWSSL